MDKINLIWLNEVLNQIEDMKRDCAMLHEDGLIDDSLWAKNFVALEDLYDHVYNIMDPPRSEG